MFLENETKFEEPENEFERDEINISKRRMLATAAGLGIMGAGLTVTGVAASEFSGKKIEVKTSKENVNSMNLPKAESAPHLKDTLRTLSESTDMGFKIDELEKLFDPIDLGAKKLLAEYSRAKLNFSPFKVEYLLDTLAEHIKNCLEIRSQAKELEILIIQTMLSFRNEDNLIKVTEEQIKFNRQNINRVLSHKVDPVIDKDSGVIQGRQIEDPFFIQLSMLEEGYLNSQRNNLVHKKSYFEKAGIGTNYKERFESLKRTFNLELVEAYKRARSVSAGLYSFYGISHAVPELTNIGFLDDLSIWTRRAVYLLEEVVLHRDESEVVVPLGKIDNVDFGILEKEVFAKQRGAHAFRFSIAPSAFERAAVGLKKPLLRGLSLAISGQLRHDLSHAGGISARVELEEKSAYFPDKSEAYKVSPKASFAFVDFLHLRQSKVERKDSLYNVDPVGTWEIFIDNWNYVGKHTDHVNLLSNMFLIMTVSHAIS